MSCLTICGKAYDLGSEEIGNITKILNLDGDIAQCPVSLQEIKLRH